MEPKDVLKRLDADFAIRIARRDESVLRDIQSAYERSLRRLLDCRLGPALNTHDIDDILSKTLLQVWTGYKEAHGMSVRGFYFSVGKRRLQDRLRMNLRRIRRDEKAMPDILAQARVRDPFPECVIDEELATTAGGSARAIGLLIDEAVRALNARQKRAFLRRFGAVGSNKWAKELETETGVPAKQWRKASDEARAKVRNFLADHGVRFSKEGGRYEVA